MTAARTGGPILVLNAGSSSIKCGLYEGAGPRLAQRARVHAHAWQQVRAHSLPLPLCAAARDACCTGRGVVLLHGIQAAVLSSFVSVLDCIGLCCVVLHFIVF